MDILIVIISTSITMTAARIRIQPLPAILCGTAVGRTLALNPFSEACNHYGYNPQLHT